MPRWRTALGTLALFGAVTVLACPGCSDPTPRESRYYAPPSFDVAAAGPARDASRPAPDVPRRPDLATAPPDVTAPAVDVSPPVPEPRFPVAATPSALPDFAGLYRNVRPTVVSLYTTHKASRRPGAGRGSRGAEPRESLGSGIVLTADGEVLTNEHVVRDWARVRARLADGRTYEVTVLGTDPPTDLALLQLEGLDGPLQPAELGDSDAAQVGDWVAAVGNPLGLENTMTRGIISAKGRRQLQNDPRSYMEFLQTDAAINPGSSGGPLFDLDGRVVGINAALNKEGQGIAFAIPANMAREIVLRLRESGVVERGWLGVIITPVEGAEEGVRVIDALPGSPAHGAGLVDGDIIRTVEGVPVASPFDLRWRIAMAGVGQRVTLEVRRAGESRLVSVTLGSLGGGRATTRRRP